MNLCIFEANNAKTFQNRKTIKNKFMELNNNVIELNYI